MKTVRSRLAMLTAALMAWMVSGCATQGVQGGTGGTAKADAAASAAPGAATVAAPQSATAAARPVQQLPAPSAVEVQYGIQVAQIGLTASGGLVDVRFKVLDPVKAKALLRDPANAPMLIAGGKPPLTAPHHALHGARFGAGQVFYILYPNARGAVQPGAEVTVAIGPARLGPVTAH